MSKIEKSIKKILNGVEVKEYKIGEICEVLSGNGNILKKDIEKIENGIFPVYSASTRNDGIIGYINTYDHEGEMISFTQLGNVGTFFYRTGKYSCTENCGLIKLKDNNISLKYLYYYLVSNFVLNKTRGAFTHLSKNIIKNFKVKIPSIEHQEKVVKYLDKLNLLEAELEARKKQYIYYRNALIGNSDIS